MIFRLFFISFWVWLISHVLFRRRHFNVVFGFVTAFSAIAFTLGHLPSVMFLVGADTMGQVHKTVYLEILLLNGVLSVAAALFLRRSALLAAVGVHFWTDVVWHVVWGATVGAL